MRRPSNESIEADEAKKALRLYGLTTVERGNWFLAIHPENTKANLFKGSDEFKNLDITLPIGRITGAESRKASFGNNTSLTSIQIPMTIIDELRGFAS
jgi:hypothetical protein